MLHSGRLSGTNHAYTEYLAQFAFLEDGEGSPEKLLNLIERFVGYKIRENSFMHCSARHQFFGLPSKKESRASQAHVSFFSS